MSDSIQVAIKVRPLIKREKDENLPLQWTVANNGIIPVDPEKKRGEGGFQFDHIFDPEKTNEHVFETVVKPIIDAAVKGFNGTVFAYGQTSSGKTHTMLGNTIEPGIIPLAVNRTFDSIAETCNREFLLRVSYLEIYNEKVNDLLDPTGVDLKLREDTNGLVQVLKCKEEIASSPEIIMTIMKKGDKNRRIGETDMNERSSRSHTIFRITIESRDVSSDSDGAIQVSQLNLVDLAGSERARQTNATGERFKEGTHINLSLSSLGLVIKQLSEASENSKQHVNFRDSKLTRLLQASLGGNAMTTIICAVTPAAFDETLCTLSFASRAKSVKNKPQLNEVMSDAALLKRYKKQLAKLNEELERIKSEKGIVEVQDLESKLQEKECKLQETDRINQILEERIELLKNSIVSAGVSAVSKEDVISRISKTKRRRTWAGDGRNYQISPCTLEPIKEDVSPEKPKKKEKLDKYSRRKSIIQTVDLNDESFETAFTDFELELIKVAKEREQETSLGIDSTDEKSFTSDKPKSLNRVKFQDDVEVFSLSSGSNYSDSLTPEKQKENSDGSPPSNSPTSSSPGTPKKVLRERLSYITQEYNSLQEFTTLERQTLFVQKEDFGSSNEKIFMQNQIDGLLERLTKSNLQQTELEEHLLLSCKCIEEFCSLTPDTEPLKDSFFNKEQRKASVSKLQNLQELLKNLKNERNNAQKSMTPLEKKLTDDYNQCIQELELIKSEKESIYKENVEVRKQLEDEKNKLKNSETLINTLRADTDCLMETLLKKNTELANLKERVVELERRHQESEITETKLETSLPKDVSVKENFDTDSVEDKEITEEKKLNQTVEEKTDDSSKLKLIEELKLENERLLQTLEDVSKTSSITDENLKTEITKLTELLGNKDQRILEYQQIETELRQKMEELQNEIKSIDSVKNLSLKSESENINMTELKQELNVSKIQPVCQEIQTEDNQIELMTIECQTDFANLNESLVLQKKNLQEQITRLEIVAQEKDIELEKYVQSELEFKNEIENLKSIQEDLKTKIEQHEKISKECQTEFTLKLEANTENLSIEKDLKITSLTKAIEQKSQELAYCKQFEEKIEDGIKRLKKCLIDILNTANGCEIEQIKETLQFDSEKIESELKTSDQIKSFEVDIEVLIKDIVNISSLNKDLKNLLNERDDKICNSQKIFDSKIQELEQKIDILISERVSLQEKIDSLMLHISSQNHEETILKLKEVIENLKVENETLKESLNKFERIVKTETNDFSDCDLNRSTKATLISEKKMNQESPKTGTSKGNQSICKFKNEEIKISMENSFVKPADVSVHPPLDVKTEIEDDKSILKPVIKKHELESSSIFANQTYFENMTFGSFVDDCTGLITGLDESKNINIVNNSTSKNHDDSNIEPMDVDTSILLENNDQYTQVEDVKPSGLLKEDEKLTVEDLKKIKVALENENAKLCNDLENKIQESEDIQRNVKEFKRTLEELQQALTVLTNENMQMSKQLTEERDSTKNIVSSLQEEIDLQRSRFSALTEDNITLKNEISILHEQLDNMRANTPIITDDDLKKKYLELQERFKNLNEENITLSTELMEKIEELEKVKESKIQMYDHQCTYREKSESLIEKINSLESENITLSSELTEHIEESDKLKEAIEVLKQQIDVYENLKSSENGTNVDLEIYKEENTRLTNELIELRSKVVQLSRENANLSQNINLDSSNESNKSLNVSQNKTRNENSISLEKSFTSQNPEENTTSLLKEKIKSLQEQVNHLTLVNQKLGDLKLPSCNQCTQLKEINQNRRQLKLEMNSLTLKHSELQKKFEQKCADVEMLKVKANESYNTSVTLMDSTFNSSMYEGVNVTLMEEKVKNLHSEVEELKENHNKLSNQYQEKCNEIEKLQVENISTPSSKKENKRSKSDTPSRKNIQRIKSLEKDLETLANDLQELRKDNANVSSSLSKYIQERSETQKQIESLKLSNDQLTREYEDKVKLLEDELASLYVQLKDATTSEKEIKAQKLEMDVQLEGLQKERVELSNSLKKAEEKLKNYSSELDEENANLKSELLKLQDIMKSKNENGNYLEQKLQDEIDFAKSRIIKEIRCLENLSEKEIKELPKKPVTDVFVSFLNAIMSKEKEIIKGLQQNFEKTKKKLEEEKQQCIDAEKRANNWAKTVEIDLEKNQADLTDLERKNQRLQDEIHRLNELLREANHENQQLQSSINNLESDMNSLHNELDKQSKKNVEKDFENIIMQEKEKIVRAKDEEWDNRLKAEKEEYSRDIDKLSKQLEICQSSNDDLKNTIEGLDLEIKHLKSTIDIKTNESVELIRKIDLLEQEMEHLEEVNQQLKQENLEKEKHEEEIRGLLKIKCDLLTEYKTKVENIQPEFECLENQLSERKQCIEKYKEEIHALKLDNKKQADILQDKLSSEEIKSAALNKQLNEYKNKNTALCCTIEEIKDRCTELERENSNLQKKVRNSLSKLRVENELQELQDENRSLKNHLEGSYNRIAALQESKSQIERELVEAQGKNATLEQELSTTQITLASIRDKYNNFNVQKIREKYESVLVEKNNLTREIEEKKMLIASKDQKLVEISIELDTLKMQNEEVVKNIKIINEEKSRLNNQLISVMGDYESFKQKMELHNSEKENVYKSLLDEKNNLSLEFDKCRQEKLEIEAKNVELDKEMDEMVDHIHKQENEIAELRDQLITGSSDINHLEKLKNLEEVNEKLRIDLRVTEVNRDKLQDEIIKLRSDKEVLYRRIEDLNFKISELESRNSSRNSSKSNSPTTQKERRRRRRSDLYCQNRNIDDDSRDFTDNDSPSVTPVPPMTVVKEECQTCLELRNKIREISLDLVSRNNKITGLEVQLKAENFPYQMKCNELNENLLAAQTRNSELKLENQKLQRALMDDSSRDCHVCRQRKLNRREQSVQTNIPTKISLTGMSSGIVEDHYKLEKMEKERNWMKDLCRSRARKIKELEQRIMELEGFPRAS